MTTIRKCLPREHYAAKFALVLRQQDDDQEVTLQVRRVIPTGKPEELQIEITIQSVGKKRNPSMHSSFVLPADLANELAEACLKVRYPNKENTNG